MFMKQRPTESFGYNLTDWIFGRLIYLFSIFFVFFGPVVDDNAREPWEKEDSRSRLAIKKTDTYCTIFPESHRFQRTD